MKEVAIQKIKMWVVILVASVTMSLGMAIALNGGASALDCNNPATSVKCEACKGASGASFDDATGKCGDTSNIDAEKTVSDTATKVINVFSFVVGIAAVIMIMVGGFKYITSQGDANSISSAKNTILYAIVGLVIVAFAQVIVRYVIGRV